MHGTQAVDQVFFLLERFAGDAVPPFVRALVDITRIERPLHERLHRPGVPRLGSADEIVERQVQPAPDRAKLRLHAIAVGDGIDAGLTRLAIHVL
jgi:hypothetical protein